MKSHRHNKKNGNETEAYTCPMQPEVKSKNPGKCEKCGMDLVAEDKQKSHAGHSSKGHSGHNGEHDHSSHHAHMARDFKKRFFISLAVTIPVLILSPMIQRFLGISGK